MWTLIMIVRNKLQVGLKLPYVLGFCHQSSIFSTVYHTRSSSSEHLCAPKQCLLIHVSTLQTQSPHMTVGAKFANWISSWSYFVLIHGSVLWTKSAPQLSTSSRKLQLRTAFILSAITFVAFKVPSERARDFESVPQISHICEPVYSCSDHAKHLITWLWPKPNMLYIVASIYSVWHNFDRPFHAVSKT